MSTLGLGLLLGLVVVVTLFAPRAASTHRALRPLRSLFPSWRFFDTIETTYVAHAREVSTSGDAGPWRPLIPPPARGPLTLLYDPRGNLLLACHAVVDQLVDELEEAGELTVDEAEALVSAELLRNVARVVGPGWPRWQLRVIACAVGPGGILTEEELYVSRVFEG
jgi:hypothetical protein